MKYYPNYTSSRFSPAETSYIYTSKAARDATCIRVLKVMQFARGRDEYFITNITQFVYEEECFVTYCYDVNLKYFAVIQNALLFLET